MAKLNKRVVSFNGNCNTLSFSQVVERGPGTWAPVYFHTLIFSCIHIDSLYTFQRTDERLLKGTMDSKEVGAMLEECHRAASAAGLVVVEPTEEVKLNFQRYRGTPAEGALCLVLKLRLGQSL